MKIVKQLQELGAKCNGFVVGLSGGIDSSVVACLAKQANVNTIGLIMPWRFTPKQDVEDAKDVAELVGMDYKIINIDHYVDVLDDGLDKISLGNLAARLRMVLLYREANKNNLIVLGTGNRTEFELGYFTKHGDGAADFFPLKNMWKTDVINLAKELGVPEKIITKKPSAGFWHGQTDEEELGMSYEEIDRQLKSGEISDKLKEIMDKNNHKKQI
jgi:NAD+ synthase